MFSKKVLWIAIPLVAVLGIGAAGAGYKHYGGHHDPERMVERVSEKLDLNAEQRQKLELVKDALIQTKGEMHKERADVMGQLIEEVRKQEMDQARILDLVEQRKAKFDVMAPQVLGPVIEFHKSLNDDQREKVVNLLETLRDWGHGFGKWRSHGSGHG